MKMEKWECKKCGSACRVEIEYSDDKLPDFLKGNERFRNKNCPCNETTPDWEMVYKGKINDKEK